VKRLSGGAVRTIIRHHQLDRHRWT
jgi:hypothetical protein